MCLAVYSDKNLLPEVWKGKTDVKSIVKLEKKNYKEVQYPTESVSSKELYSRKVINANIDFTTE